jgi:transposase
LVAQVAPQLLTEPGFGPLTAGKLIGEIAGAQRFCSDAKLARASGIAPIPVSSGNTTTARILGLRAEGRIGSIPGCRRRSGWNLVVSVTN